MQNNTCPYSTHNSLLEVQYASYFGSTSRISRIMLYQQEGYNMHLRKRFSENIGSPYEHKEEIGKSDFLEEDSTPSQLYGPLRNIFDIISNACTLSRFSSTRSSQFSAILMLILIFSNAKMFLSRLSLQTLETEGSEFLLNFEEPGKRVLRVEEDIHRLHHTLSTLNAVPEWQETTTLNNSQQSNYSAEIHNVTNEINSLQMKVQYLKDHIQKASKMEIIRNYGEGIHLVEIELAFPDQVDGPDKFVVELASIDDMPHSVQIFLDIVSAGLLDGCSFLINAPHILKAVLLPHDGSSATEKARAFMQHGLETVGFKEYSESYPHKTYTIGFPIDGNPGFYINMEDNTDVYVGDPCFGTVVSGFDTIARMKESPTINGIWLEQRIGIKHAQILELHKN